MSGETSHKWLLLMLTGVQRTRNRVYGTLGWSQAVQHCSCNTLLTSALLSKNNEVVGENNSVTPTMLYILTPAFVILYLLYLQEQNSEIKAMISF